MPAGPRGDCIVARVRDNALQGECFLAFWTLSTWSLSRAVAALDVRRFARRLLGRSAPVARPVEQTIWYRWTKAVMRRSIPIGLAIVALLLVLGAPFSASNGAIQTTACYQAQRRRARSVTSCAPVLRSIP